MYESITKKFRMKSGEKEISRRNLKNEVITAKQIEETQDSPDTWILIGENNGKDRR